MGKVSSFINNSVRILRLAKKPDKQEFMFVSKVTALGIIVIGFVGYIVETIKYILS